MMEDLLGAGFHTIDRFPMWLPCDSAKGERVFADCFFDPGAGCCGRISGRRRWRLWIGDWGYFPFPYSV